MSALVAISRRSFLWLFGLGLAAVLCVSIFQRAPGYMDADYYYAGGLRLASGAGFSEQVLWNYLDDPAGLPHPSHAYWMPLASLLSALGLWLVPQGGFAAARLPFWLLAACVPPLTAQLAYQLYAGWPERRRMAAARWAGLLAVFPAFYLPYLGATDTFAIYMLLGAAFLLLAGRLLEPDGVRPLALGGRSRPRLVLLLGLVAGAMHLARADGLLYLGLAGLLALLPALRRRQSPGAALLSLGWLLGGYLLVMGPWFARNLAAFGAPLAPGGARALWITEYDETFFYPAGLLTPARWLAHGLGPALDARLWALGQNLQTIFAVQGSILLTPFILLGAWRLRQAPLVRWGLLAWLLTLAVMTLVFPFAGARGGFFHSGAALQPLWWALAPAGLAACLEWAVQRRGWQMERSWAMFAGGLLFLAALLTGLLVVQRVFGSNPAQAAWSAAQVHYRALEDELAQQGAEPQQVVLVVNPPGYFVATQRPAIAVPAGDERALPAVVQRYGPAYLLLGADHPANLNDLYAHPGDRPGLRYLSTLEGTHIFQVLPQPAQAVQP